jgi:putative membrane protein
MSPAKRQGEPNTPPGGDERPFRDAQQKAAVTEQRSRSETTGRRLVYFAAERTLLAWVRSALGLMALGFVIDRFGLVLRHVIPGEGEQLHPTAFSFWAGTMLVIVGALMAFVAAGRYLRFSIAYHRDGDTDPRHGIGLGVLFTAVLGLFGLLIAAFLTLATHG